MQWTGQRLMLSSAIAFFYVLLVLIICLYAPLTEYLRPILSLQAEEFVLLYPTVTKSFLPCLRPIAGIEEAFRELPAGSSIRAMGTFIAQLMLSYILVLSFLNHFSVHLFPRRPFSNTFLIACSMGGHAPPGIYRPLTADPLTV